LNTDRYQGFANRLAITALIFVSVNILAWTFPGTDTWNSRVYDFLFKIRSQYQPFQPPYNDTVVHVDVDDTSLQHLETYYLTRSHFSRIIRNLSAMGVSAQLYDFIFAAPSNVKDDSALIQATRQSQNTYLGLAFKFDKPSRHAETSGTENEANNYLKASNWKVIAPPNAAGFEQANDAVVTFQTLAETSRGLGFLNMTPDADSVFRRVPLLIQYRDDLYPSLPFRVICDFLEVLPEDIIVEPGKEITLLHAKIPGTKHDQNIKIPTDRHNNLIINFLGPWGRMKHYRFSDIYRASEDQDEIDIWQEELSGKIVVVADVSTGSSDIGAVPTDAAYPLSGLNASVLNTILTQKFIHEVSRTIILVCELFLLLIVVVLSFQKSSLTFFISTMLALCGYILIAAFLFLFNGLILNIISPVILTILILVAMQIVRALENARTLQRVQMEKSLFERELEIGRKIQADFFPKKIPEMPDYEVSAYFKPARQVAGDFYDIFWLDENRLLAIVIADVCDKGVGAALFMALIRSLIRVSSNQSIQAAYTSESQKQSHVQQALINTIQVTSDYIAKTHGDTNMFATMFVGVLDREKSCLYYANCGHEPPIIVKKDNQYEFLKPTGPAIGLFSDLTFDARTVSLLHEDLLFAYTDGVLDTAGDMEEQFSKEKLLSILSGEHLSTPTLIQEITKELEKYTSSHDQFDDITMIALRKT